MPKTFAEPHSINFKIDRQQSYAHIPELIKRVLSTLEQIKAVPQQERRFENTAAVLIESHKELNLLWALLSHYQKVLNDESLRDQHARAQQELVSLDNTLSFDKELMTLYEDLLLTQDLSSDEKLFLEYEIKDFKLSGVNQPDDVQKRLQDIHMRLSELSLSFQNNLLDSTYQWVRVLSPEELVGLNQNVCQYFEEIFLESKDIISEKYGSTCTYKHAINLSQGCIQPILSQSPNRELREIVFKAAQIQCSPFDEVSSQFNNSENVENILKLRKELAQLLGYESYQQMKLENRFASSVSDINNLYERAIQLLKPAAEKEFKAICALAKKKDGLQGLEPWDVSYYTELWRKENLSIDAEELRRFFPVNRVLEVMLEIFKDVFALDMHINFDSCGWHPDVFDIKIFDKNDLIGTIYCDLFARSNKDQGAWMDDLRSAEMINNAWQPAIAILCCNFRPGAPAELLFDEVLTLFHEFGHCLHHILSRRSLAPISGLGRVPWDIVELPSQLFEKWCYERPWLEKMSTDIRTGEGLSEAQISALMKEQSILSGLFYLRQVQLGYFDWQLHGAEERSAVLFWHEISQKISVTPRYADSHFPLCFSHIFAGGYSAGYYSYLWADLYVAQVFEKFKSYSSMRQAGLDFRKHFLGKAAPWDLKYQLEEHFLKAPQSLEPFMRSIGYESLL